jgi:uncharacterized protein (DUF4415 family)
MKTKRVEASARKAVRGRRSGTKAQALRERDWLAGAGTLYRPIKKPVTLRLDADLLQWFKRRGRGYQTRINAALRAVMMKERKAGGKS